MREIRGDAKLRNATGLFPMVQPERPMNRGRSIAPEQPERFGRQAPVKRCLARIATR
jgi:hypothetical protein